MTIQLKLRGGTATQHGTFTGLAREVTVNTTNNTLRVHDGVTPGGYELMKNDLSNITVDISDAATLNGQPGSYYNNYNNLSNKPSIPSIAGLATETYVDGKISDILGGAPGALNTLAELADALNNDDNFAGSVTLSLSQKLNNNGDTMAGVLIISDTTPSTSTVTGALKVAGGIGAQGRIHAPYFVGDGSLLTNVGGLIGVSYPTTYTGTALLYNAGNRISEGLAQPQTWTVSSGVVSIAGNPLDFVSENFVAGATLTIKSTLFVTALVSNKIIESVTSNTITLVDKSITGSESLDFDQGGYIQQIPTYASGPKQNVALGPNSLANRLPTALQNVSVGEDSSKNISSGSNNVIVGYNGASTMSTGSNNIGLGSNVLLSMQDGNSNIVIGNNALRTATTGNSTLAIGNNALYNKGPSGGTVIAIGDSAGYNYGIGGATATGSTIIGYQAMYNGGGVSSVALGYQSLYQSTGNACIAIGSSSGISMTSGNFNVIIGSNNGSTISGTDNNIILADGQGQIAAQWQTGGGWYQANNNASWSVTSDRRLKTNIEDITDGLEIIMALRSRRFLRIVEGTRDVGFIAQEYELVLPDQVIETPAPREEFLELTEGEPIKGIQQNIIPYLVNAVQTLKHENDALKARLLAANI